MKLYFSNSQIPELAPLTPAQRKAVLRCAMEAFFAEDSSRVWAGLPWLLGGGLGGALLAGLIHASAGFTHSRVLVIIAGGLVGFLLGTFIATQFQTAQIRPYYRRVLEERRTEIANIK
jgi:hypothetical protein